MQSKGFGSFAPAEYCNGYWLNDAQREDEYRKLFHGEAVLMRGFEDRWGVYDALARLKGYQEPRPDAKTGKPVYWGAYRIERRF